MKLSFHGAAQTVTGSMHLVDINGSRLLLDCGLYQGKRAESIKRNRTFPFNVNSINAVILSHAHIDGTDLLHTRHERVDRCDATRLGAHPGKTGGKRELS
jgi:Cft2 family RNA processing exonuclease